MKIESCNLSGKALDLMVLDAYCREKDIYINKYSNCHLDYKLICKLIGDYRISVIYVNPETDPNPLKYGTWTAGCEGLEYGCTGSTFIEAGLRCFVALKLGYEVEVPDELFK